MATENGSVGRGSGTPDKVGTPDHNPQSAQQANSVTPTESEGTRGDEEGE